MKIKNLQLFTSRLTEQITFYEEVLEMKVTIIESGFFVMIGDSMLSFIEGEDFPYYHFAINIPANKIDDALVWLKKRVEVIKMDNKEIVDFPNWNAESIYFYDKDHNIIEFIARKNLKTETADPFSSESFLCISEAGLPVNNVKSFVQILTNQFDLYVFDGDLERFCAVGSETGLFIVVNYLQKKWIPNMDEAIPYPFSIEIQNNKGKLIGFNYSDEKIQLTNIDGVNNN